MCVYFSDVHKLNTIIQVCDQTVTGITEKHRETKLVEKNGGKQSDSIPTLNSVLRCEDTEFPFVGILS